MSVASQQIGWSQKDKLLWNISKQLEVLTQVTSNIVLTTSTSTSTSTSTTTITTTLYPVTDGLILLLDAGNVASYSGTGTTFTDLTGNGYNATIQGSVPFTSAGAASYFTLNGSISNYFLGNNNLYGTNPNQISGTVGVSFSVVFKPSNINTRSFLFSNYDTAGYDYEIGTLGGLWTNTLRSFMGSPGSSSDNRGTSSVLSNGTTYLMTFTWDQINKISNIYLNGTLIPQDHGSYNISGLANWANQTNYTLGKDPNGGSYGNMYVALVYNRALTSEEVLFTYDAIKSRFGL